MRVASKSVFALLAVLFGATASVALFPPGSTKVVEGVVAGPFQPIGGPAYSTTLTIHGDSKSCRSCSRLKLFEDGKLLGQPHSPLEEIRKTGSGTYSHWLYSLRFAASDNTDPRTNGRHYRFRSEVLRAPPWVPLASVIVAGLAALGLLTVLADGSNAFRARRLILGGVGLAGAVMIVEAMCYALLRSDLALAEGQHRRLYQWMTGDAGASNTHSDSELDGLAGTGVSSNFAPHPLMNFVLNPDATYMGVAQFDKQYLIRRTEPLRPREVVRWRALVLGGSTTFNEGVRLERDTWVRRLEVHIREANGDQFDVVNGGVGGYALVDNLLHYTLLLRELKPDLVILFTGINDVHGRLLGDTSLDYRGTRRPWAGGEAEWVRHLKPFFATSAARYIAWRRIKAGQIGHIYSLVMWDYPPLATWEDALRRHGPERYRSYLEFAIKLFQAQGHQVLVLPQVWKPRANSETDRVFGIGVDEHNLINADAARKFGVGYGDTLLAPKLFEQADMYDNCHFNVAGNKKMAAAVHELLRRSGIVN